MGELLPNGKYSSQLKELDSWLRNRLRYCIYAWSRTRMGGWAVAQSPILVTTITLKRLIQRGYESLLDYYERVLNLMNRCIRDPLGLS